MTSWESQPLRCRANPREATVAPSCVRSSVGWATSHSPAVWSLDQLAVPASLRSRPLQNLHLNLCFLSPIFLQKKSSSVHQHTQEPLQSIPETTSSAISIFHNSPSQWPLSAVSSPSLAPRVENISPTSSPPTSTIIIHHKSTITSRLQSS